MYVLAAHECYKSFLFTLNSCKTVFTLGLESSQYSLGNRIICKVGKILLLLAEHDS